MKEFLKKYFLGDHVIWAVITGLTLISIMVVFSASGSLVHRYHEGNTTFYLFRHLKFIALGLVLLYFTHRLPYKWFAKFAKPLLLIAIPLLLITLIFGESINAASRWLTVPGLGVAFQTSDFAKLALIIFVAKLLANNQKSEKGINLAFRHIAIATAIVCGLILPANLSTAALLFITIFFMMFIGRIPFKNLAFTVGVLLAIFSFYVVVSLVLPGESRVETWKNRIESFMDEEGSDNFQAEQSKIAIVTGGIFGKGPGLSTQRNHLPHPYSDFIYAIIIEEYGTIGGILVMFFYFVLLFRTVRIVNKCDRFFPAFLSIGLAISLVLQAVVNMAVAVNIIPVTGQPLPLISMGGTSMIFTCISLGIILSVSRSIELEKAKMKVAAVNS